MPIHNIILGLFVILGESGSDFAVTYAGFLKPWLGRGLYMVRIIAPPARAPPPRRLRVAHARRGTRRRRGHGPRPQVFVATMTGGVCLKDKNVGLKTLKTVAGLGFFFCGLIYTFMGAICLKRLTEGVKPRSKPLANSDSLDDARYDRKAGKGAPASGSYGSTKSTKSSEMSKSSPPSSSGGGGAGKKYEAGSSPSSQPKPSGPPPADDNPFSSNNYKEEKGGLWS